MCQPIFVSFSAIFVELKLSRCMYVCVSAREDNEDQVLAEGEELKPINKCYSTIEVSTNSSDAYRCVCM